jgi:hypothetical protein
LASWYRYRLQAENSQALFLLVSRTPCAKSCTSVVLHCSEANEHWEYANENENGVPLLSELEYHVSADRKRASARELPYSLGKKRVTGIAAHWKRKTLWAG